MHPQTAQQINLPQTGQLILANSLPVGSDPLISSEVIAGLLFLAVVLALWTLKR